MRVFAFIITWNTTVGVVGGIIIVQSFLKEVFGISMLGKRIYKGAPGWWKAFISQATWRTHVEERFAGFEERFKNIENINSEQLTILSEIRQTQKSIHSDLQYNGGNNIKDIIRDNRKEILQLMRTVAFNALRLDSNDVMNNRMAFYMSSRRGVVFSNEVLLRTFGFAETDIESWNYENFVHTEDVKTQREAWERSFEKKSNLIIRVRIKPAYEDAYKLCVVRGWPDKTDEIETMFYGTVEILK